MDGDGLLKRIPLTLLDRVVVNADVEVSSRLLGALAREQVGMLFFSGRGGGAAVLSGGARGDARRRLGQASMALSEGRRSSWARRFVHAKALGQARLLRHWADERADARMRLCSQAEKIENSTKRLLEPSLELQSIRGLEGATSAAYFAGLGEVVADALGFKGRNRRPPRDPVNAALSLLYTICYAAAVEALESSGLDPGIGYLHETGGNRAALACDLMEPVRPAADQIVVQLFRGRILRKEHFHMQDDGACLLGKAGRQVFYDAVGPSIEKIRHQLRRLASVVARAADVMSCEGESGVNEPTDEWEAAPLS